MTVVEGVERRVNKHPRQWLGIPLSFTAVGRYIRSGQLKVPLSSVVEEFKVAKCRVAMMHRDSRDKLAMLEQQQGQVASGQAESSLKLKDIIANLCMGRQRLGTSHFHQWSKASTEERTEMV